MNKFDLKELLKLMKIDLKVRLLDPNKGFRHCLEKYIARIKSEQKRIMAKKKTLPELKIEREELGNQQEAIGKKLIRNYKQIEKLLDKESEEFVKKIPKTLSRISAEQWKWILKMNHEISSRVRYDYCSQLLEKAGLYSSGFQTETEQRAFVIGLYYSTEEKRMRVMKKNFKIIMPHLKEITVNEVRGREIGIPLQIFSDSIGDDVTPIAYIKKKTGKVRLYTCKYSEVKKLNSFDDLVDYFRNDI